MASLGPPTSNLVAGVDDDDDLCVKQAILGLDFELDSLTPGRSPGCQLRSSGSHPDRIPGFHQSTYFGTCQSPESAVKPSQAKPSQAKRSQAKPAEDVVAATHAPTHARMHSRNQPRAVSWRCLCCDFAQPVPASDLRLRVAGSSSSFTSTCDSSSRDRARRSAANRLRNPGLSLPWADRTALCRKPRSVAAWSELAERGRSHLLRHDLEHL